MEPEDTPQQTVPATKTRFAIALVLTRPFADGGLDAVQNLAVNDYANEDEARGAEIHRALTKYPGYAVSIVSVLPVK